MNSERIFLIGMPYAGKSTLGKQLAKALDWKFLDMDEAIELHEKKTISEIFKLYGEAYFREAEQRVLHQVGLETQTLIATGGGTPCFFDNLAWMKDRGKVIFLDQELDVLVARAFATNQNRPLIKTQSHFEVRAQLQKLLNHRIRFYQQAHQRISNPENLTSDDLELFAL